MPLITGITMQEQEKALRRPEAVDALCAELRSLGARRVILLGIPAAMQESFLKAPLAKAGIMVLTPPAEGRAWLEKIVEQELKKGIIAEETKAAFEALVADGAEHGVDHLVIASVELMGLVSACSLELPTVDALRTGDAGLALRRNH